VAPEDFFEEVLWRHKKWRFLGLGQFEAMFPCWRPEFAVPLALVGHVLDLIETRPALDAARMKEEERLKAAERAKRDAQERAAREEENERARLRRNWLKKFNASPEGVRQRELRALRRKEREAARVAAEEHAQIARDLRKAELAHARKVREANVDAEARRNAKALYNRLRRHRMRDINLLLLPDSPQELFGTNNTSSLPGYAAHQYGLERGRRVPLLWEERFVSHPYQRR
jgi:hypothetical protein